MREIPADVMEAAKHVVLFGLRGWGSDEASDVDLDEDIELVARAILAERERIAAWAERYDPGADNQSAAAALDSFAQAIRGEGNERG